MESLAFPARNIEQNVYALHPGFRFPIGQGHTFNKPTELERTQVSNQGPIHIPVYPEFEVFVCMFTLKFTYFPETPVLSTSVPTNT